MFKWLNDLIARNDMTSGPREPKSATWYASVDYIADNGEHIRTIRFRYEGRPITQAECERLMDDAIDDALSADPRFEIL